MNTAAETYRYGKLHVRYFDIEVPTVVVGRAVYFPIRALCKAINMAPQMQIERLRGDSRIVGALRDLPVPTSKGIRDTVCINKRATSVWLGSIDPARCPITAKGPIKQFQDELFAAADRFLFGETGQDLLSGPMTMGTIKAGACPHCGTHLLLEITDSGVHLVEDEE